MANKNIYYLIQHDRGNHSATQVYYNGSIIIKGTKAECKKELINMRKICKIEFNCTSTNNTLKHFLSYQMANIYFIKKDKNNLISQVF